MTDFFREVEEEMRKDRMKRIWRNYGWLFVALAVFIVVGTAAYRGYLYYHETQAAASGDRYLRALTYIDDGRRQEASIILNQLAEDGYAKYPVLARFSVASNLLQEGQASEALAAYDALGGSSDVPSELQDYANLQAAMIAVDLEGFEAVQTRVGGLVTGDNPWRELAMEALALSAWKAGDIEETARWVAEIKSAVGVPEGTAARARLLEELIISRGGTIPEPSENS
ncbi:MAG: tetratricopeptide repeat protein [Pseudomonadota bacterium]